MGKVPPILFFPSMWRKLIYDFQGQTKEAFQVAEPKIKREELTVEEIEHAYGELIDVAKENYIAGIELSLSIYSENVRLLGKQMESWFALQHDYADLMRVFLGKFPGEGMGLWGGTLKNPFAAQVDWYFSLQNGYFELFK